MPNLVKSGHTVNDLGDTQSRPEWPEGLSKSRPKSIKKLPKIIFTGRFWHFFKTYPQTWAIWSKKLLSFALKLHAKNRPIWSHWSRQNERLRLPPLFSKWPFSEYTSMSRLMESTKVGGIESVWPDIILQSLAVYNIENLPLKDRIKIVKVGTKVCQNFSKLLKFVKVAKFGQIWSHWLECYKCRYARLY